MCAVVGVVASSAVAQTPGQEQYGGQTTQGVTPPPPPAPTPPPPAPTPPPPAAPAVTQTTQQAQPTQGQPAETMAKAPTASAPKRGAVANQGPTVRRQGAQQAAPRQQRQRPSLFQAARRSLPFTGFQAAIVLLGGALLMGSGLALRRFSSNRAA